MQDRRDRMAVIGAGPVGLGIAKALKAHAIAYDQFEADDDVGGNWYHGVYSTAHIISSRKTTEFTDMDADWGAGFARSSQHFVDALVHGTPAAMTAGEATDVLRLCFAVYQAGRTRGPVDPRLVTGSVSPPGWGEW